MLSPEEEKRLVGEVIQYSKLDALKAEGKLDLDHLKRKPEKKPLGNALPPLPLSSPERRPPGKSPEPNNSVFPSLSPEKPKLVPTNRFEDDDGFGHFDSA